MTPDELLNYVAQAEAQRAQTMPKGGTAFKAIEPGSTGLHNCHYEGEWPNGHWYGGDNGDMWPMRPCLWKSIASEVVTAEQADEYSAMIAEQEAEERALKALPDTTDFDSEW